MSERSAFGELFRARLREFVREPGVLFWVFGFPILLAIGLGLAFHNKPPDEIVVGVIDMPGAERVTTALTAAGGFQVRRATVEQAEQDLRLGHVSIVVGPGESYEYRFDPSRPDSLLAQQRVDDVLQRAAGRTDVVGVTTVLTTKPGARYIDFLIPGLLGMNIMSGGMWGVGYVIVDMRSRKLLKRLVATPMRRSHFLAAMMASRMVVVFAEIAILLFFGWLVFDVAVQGPLWQIAALSVLGAFAFSSLGLLVASRTKKTETVSGLMNLVMLPMFVFSGVFFSAERFPAEILPYVKALPLTALNDGLRAVALEGVPLTSLASFVAILAAWGVVSFVAALRVFRWS